MVNIHTDPKFVEGFPVTISPAGNIENETEERITKRGFAGINLRWECRECGEVMWR